MDGGGELVPGLTGPQLAHRRLTWKTAIVTKTGPNDSVVVGGAQTARVLRPT
jgi:hypothetical protein